MLTISKALSTGQARTYHAREFVSDKQNYWGRDETCSQKVVLTVEQYRALLAELPYHIQVMVMIAMCLGLRISRSGPCSGRTLT
jgi:hypothetical protein